MSNETIVAMLTQNMNDGSHCLSRLRTLFYVSLVLGISMSSSCMQAEYPASQLTKPNLGIQNTLVIPVKFNTGDPDPLNETEIYDLIFNPARIDSLDAYVEEVSFIPETSEKATLIGDIIGDPASNAFTWITVNKSSICDLVYLPEVEYELPLSDQVIYNTPTLAQALDIVNQDPSIDFNDYSRIILLVDDTPLECNMGTAGMVPVNTGDGQIMASVAWIYKSAFQQPAVLRHEIGHNFGFFHSYYYECGALQFADTGCSYGIAEGYEVMGGTWDYSPHYNSYYKEYAGFLDSSAVQTVTETGQFTILPLASAQVGVKALKIPRPSNPTRETFYVEYRQPVGYDAVITGNAHNGALIRYIRDTQSARVSSLLIDAIPSTPGTSTITDDFLDAAFEPGQEFLGGISGVTIRTVAATKTALTVDVIFPSCEEANPIRIVTTQGSGQAPAIEETLEVEFIGNIINDVGTTGTSIQVCPNSTVHYTASSTVGQAFCTLNNTLTASSGKIQVNSNKKLVCSNKPDGADTDSFTISMGG